VNRSLVALLVAAGACLPAGATTSPAPDHRTCAAVPCDDSTTNGLRVETRRSSGLDGAAGKYVYTRVSNLNPFPVVFTLDVTPHFVASGDPDILSRQWRVTLPAAEHPESSTLLSVDHFTIGSARVYGLEKVDAAPDTKTAARRDRVR
jgi:hypothetical protein